MDTDYKAKMQEALNVIEKTKEAVRKAEEDARNIVDCKNCAYSGVGIYCVRNSWTEPFKDGGCEYFSKK